MVNIDDFIKRLEIILDYYGLNASAFADKIGVQRSSLSHLLSGRNKPSLDFILKILEEFPDVDLYWILNGKGHFPKRDESQITPEDNSATVLKPSTPTPPKDVIEPTDLFSEPKNSVDEKATESNEENKNIIAESFTSAVDKIVFFYKDGSFKIFNPK